jgi:hypothetical protein
MGTLRSGGVYIKLEPQATPTNSPNPPASNVSTNIVIMPISVQRESSAETPPLCDCGNPVAEQVCKGVGNPDNLGRMMYVCPRLGGKKCKYFQWKDNASPRADNQQKQKRETTPVIDRTPEKDSTPVASNLTLPTSPQRPPPPQCTYTCDCGKPAEQYFCKNGRPENVNKYYYKCASEECKYWKWIESDEDARKRINPRKRKLDNEEGTTETRWVCYCNKPAMRLVSRHGREHNHGRAFYKCATKKCKFWIWADGTLPFSDESQARFNDYMDARLGYWDDDW